MPDSQPSICEEQTFQQIHKEYATPLRNFLYYKFGDLEVARDHTQEAFIRLWENCSKVVFEKVKNFLFTVGNRLFLDDLDHQKVKLKFQHRQSMREDQQESNPDFMYRQAEFKEDLERAISNLPEKQRAVFLLSRIDKLKNKEIADTLDISIKTVEKHIAGALQTLKSNLDELEHRKI